MADINIQGMQLEKRVRSNIIRITVQEGETLKQFLSRLDEICEKIEEIESEKERSEWVQDMKPEVIESIAQVQHLFGLTDEKRSEAGLTGDYHMVMLSLLKNFDQCLGSTAIANEWKINSGRVSRVFTASRKQFKVYKDHFEKCKEGGYRFTKKGLAHALDEGLAEILVEEQEE